jgi:hypothetical protein
MSMEEKLAGGLPTRLVTAAIRSKKFFMVSIRQVSCWLASTYSGPLERLQAIWCRRLLGFRPVIRSSDVSGLRASSKSQATH